MNTLRLEEINLHSSYMVGQTEGKLDGIKNFTALFSRKDNPRLEELLAEFEETIDIVFD